MASNVCPKIRIGLHGELRPLAGLKGMDKAGRKLEGNEGVSGREEKWEDKPQATCLEKVLERNRINARKSAATGLLKC